MCMHLDIYVYSGYELSIILIIYEVIKHVLVGF
jgi:hypothetical protein